MIKHIHGKIIRYTALIFIVALAGLTTAFAQVATNRYTLILADPPTLTQIASREDFQKEAAINVRNQILSKQRAVRDRLDALGIPTTGTVTDVLNAIFVSATKDQADELKNIPGVIGVLPGRRYQKTLNRALSLLNAPQAWGLAGGSQNAGRGIKIAILDDGIDITNPMFQNSTLPMPAGFPICSGSPDACKYTNNKVIVARSYVRQLAAGTDPQNPALDSKPDDYSPSGRAGHGTGVASVAGGLPVSGVVNLNGMAPGAYLGNYKIYGSPQVNDITTDDVIISALNDAVKDGMDIVSFSTGGAALAGPLDSGAACNNPSGVPCDLVAQAFENASKAGTIIVVAAGNDGFTGFNYPTFNDISTPADAPSVIAVGASSNSHYFDASVEISGPGVPPDLQDISAEISDASAPSGAVTAPLADVAALGYDGLGCAAFPKGLLTGSFALLMRGTCSFSQKMANAVAAGAMGVVFYMADSSITFGPTGLSNFNQPAVMISQGSGISLKNFLASNPGYSISIDPSGREVSTVGGQNLLAGFSSLGPSTGDSAIKPDLVAVGEGAGGISGGIFMAATTLDPLGELYSSNGFVAADGTSFSTPMVSGAAAIVKQLHPGFTAAQVRSVLVNTASQDVLIDDSTPNPYLTDVQWEGSGKLDVGAAATALVTASPVSISFGALASNSLPTSKQLAITNGGASSVSLSLATVAASGGSGTVPSLGTRSLSIAAGATQTVSVTLSGSVPKAGEYSGAITLQGPGVTLRVPYMYLVGNNVPANIIPLMGDFNVGTVNEAIPDGQIAFKIADDVGLPVKGIPATFRARNGGTLSNASTTTDNYGIARANVTLGSQPGTYSFTAVAGGLSYTFADFARSKPTIGDGGIVNSAGFTAGAPVAPGSYISIFGTGLSDTEDFTPSVKLPLAIDFVNVSFDAPSAKLSLPGRLIYVSPNQVNVQVPWELQGINSAQVKVKIDFTFGNVVTLGLSDFAPGIYEFSPGVAAAQDANYRNIGTDNPAKRGQTIVLYANGLGPVTNQPADGDIALTSPLSQTTSTPIVTIGGQSAQVVFSGLSPGYPALYQINVVIPQNVNPGNNSLAATIGGHTSNQSGIAIQ